MVELFLGNSAEQNFISKMDQRPSWFCYILLSSSNLPSTSFHVYVEFWTPCRYFRRNPELLSHWRPSPAAGRLCCNGESWTGLLGNRRYRNRQLLLGPISFAMGFKTCSWKVSFNHQVMSMTTWGVAKNFEISISIWFKRCVCFKGIFPSSSNRSKTKHIFQL